MVLVSIFYHRLSNDWWICLWRHRSGNRHANGTILATIRSIDKQLGIWLYMTWVFEFFSFDRYSYFMCALLFYLENFGYEFSFELSKIKKNETALFLLNIMGHIEFISTLWLGLNQLIYINVQKMIKNLVCLTF